MSLRPRILVVGSTNIDFVASVERAPESGETVVSDGTYGFVPGGKSANSAVAAARLGADVIFCARAGNDTYGRSLCAAYKNEGVDIRYMNIDKTLPTGLAAITVEKNGANRIVVFPGANLALSKDDVEEAFMSYPDALLLQLEIDPEVVLYAIRQANGQNIPVILDAGPVVSSLPLEAFEGLSFDIFSPNESEAYAYTNIMPLESESYLRICYDIYSRIKTKYVVLKLGDKGAYVYDGHRGECFPSYLVKSVDSTAAGDAFTAGLTYEYLRSGNIRSSTKYANAVGALTVTKSGAFTSLPKEAEVIEFIRSREM